MNSAARQIPALEDFPSQTFDKLRYADTDRQGHVNNAVFATFFETGRVELLYDPGNPALAGGRSFVIANLTLDFLAEVNWPGRVEIGTGVTRIGTSSVGIAQGLFQAGQCVATATSVIVQVDDHSGKASPLAEETRAFLDRYRLP